jgi:hypothetical protein
LRYPVLGGTSCCVTVTRFAMLSVKSRRFSVTCRSKVARDRVGVRSTICSDLFFTFEDLGSEGGA